jgi:serine/threonine protein kinase/WD40 repeat protein
MSDDVLYAPAILDLLDRFLAEYRRATRPEQVLDKYAARHPELADEFRLQAGFCAIDPGDEPAELPDINLLREIGRGGMGVVYEGWQESLDRPVAVKLHRMTDARAERGRFFHECRTLARLHQTSIVPVHTAGRSGPWLYSVMPLIEGATLAELIRRARAQANSGPLSTLPALVTGPVAGTWDLPADQVIRPGPAYIRSAVEVMVMAAEAIDHAHHEGVWHLDLKPANLMLDAGGHCWIIDFGIARRAGSDDEPEAPARSVTDTEPATQATAPPTAGAPFLTLAYAAPERWRGAADARSDVWGLGATLYELLTLRRPFPTKDANTLAQAVAECDPVSPQLLTDDLPRDLSAICQKALMKRADDRYATAGAFAADLRRWLGGYETTARPWSPVARFVRRTRRHKPWAVAAGSVVLGVLSAFILLWRQELIRADEAKAKGQAAVAEERLLRETDSHAKARIWTLLEMARQRSQLTNPGRRADVRRMLLTAARERRSAVPDGTSPLQDVTFRSLYAESLGLLDLAEPLERADLPEHYFRDWPAAIHPDGRLAAIGAGRRPLVWRRGGPKPAVDPADKDVPRAQVAYGPAGEYLAELLPEETGGGLRLWDREATRMLRELIPPSNPKEPKPGSLVRAIGFDEKETRLWAARADGHIVAWELPTFKPLAEWPLVKRPAGRVTAAAFDPTARTIALGDDRGRVTGYDQFGTVTVTRSVLPAKAVVALAWGPDGRTLGVGTDDGIVHLFDPVGALVFRANISASGVARIAFTPDGRWVTAHYRDTRARFWDTHTGRLALLARAPVWGFSRDGRTLVSTTTRTVQFEEVLYPTAVLRLQGHRASIDHLTWSADGKRLASLASNYELRVWDVERPVEAVRTIAAPHTGGFFAENAHLALSPDGKRLAYASGGSREAIAAVYDVESGRELGKWENLPDGFETVAPVGRDGFVLVREQTVAEVRDLPEDREFRPVEAVLYDLVPGRPRGEGRVIRPTQARDVRRFISHWILPDGRHYLWAGPRKPEEDRRVELYDIAAGKMVWSIHPKTPSDPGAPVCVLTEDLRYLWIGRYPDGALQFDLNTPDPPRRVREMPMSVSRDLKWMAYMMEPDPTSLIHRVSVRPWPGELRLVDFACPDANYPSGGTYLFSPDGRFLAWGALDGTITLVDLPLLAERVQQFEADMAKAE